MSENNPEVDAFAAQPSRSRGPISSSTVKRLFAEAAGSCSFPGCDKRDPDDQIEIAYIVALSATGPRGGEDTAGANLGSIENMVLLCPEHHVHVDAMPDQYDGKSLRRMKAEHGAHVAAALVPGPERDRASTIARALETWRTQRTNRTEEFWHRLFTQNPSLLIAVAPASAHVLESKCYVGGKLLTNTGGNIADFIARGDGNVTLVEIKPPTDHVVGQQYRGNVWSPAPALVGACLQVLVYKTSLLNNVYALRADGALEAPDPQCVVIIGDLESERLSDQQRRCFEIYRQALRHVVVVTYDELFSRLELISSALQHGDS